MRRGETPFYAFLYRTAKWLLAANLPIPSVLSPLFRAMYHLHWTVWGLSRRAISFFYREPLFRFRCEKAGKNLQVNLLPVVSSNVKLFLGDNVSVDGKLLVFSGIWFKDPRFVVGNKVHIGHMALFSVNREIVIEDGVLISSDCFFADNDGHPTDPELRASGKAVPEDNVKPIRICKNAWIGHGCHILKGVTIGEASIIAAASVVVKDVPPYSVYAGNPGRVVAEIPRGPKTGA